MRRLARLFAVTAGMAILLSGTVVGFAAIGTNAVHHVASAQELPLPPINSKLQEPSTVYADDGTTVLAKLSGPEFRQPVKLSQISKTTIAAVLDTEDHGFYVHGGFDIPSIIRAAVTDAQGQGLQGGSTIPQQLVKQLYLTPARTISRKIREAVLADRLEQKYTKDQILQAYLNTIYLGSGAYGVQAAAETYFGIPASKLDLAQSALLAGMIQDPSGYDPILRPAVARDRRAQVLQRMLTVGDINRAQMAAANRVPLPTTIKPNSTPTVVEQDPIAGYYVNQVKNFLLDSSTVLGATYTERYDALFEGGLKIVTNLDPNMQAAAEQAVTNDTPANSGGFEEGLVSIDPANGAVRALVGGTGAQAQQFDVMTQGLRQPGSGFKLFTLITALEQGYSVYDSVDSQSPCAILFPGNTSLATSPINNDNGPGGGVISVVQATADSVNCAYIRLGHEVGLHNVISTAQALGISPKEVPHSTYDYIPSVVIGAAAVRPIEMAGAYATVADGGVFHAPSFIYTVTDRSGTVVYNGMAPGRRVFSTQVAAEADVAFRAVVTGGTGTAASIYNRPVAGKTGTTNNNADAWFNAYTPQLETTVWMGNLASDNVPIYIPGFGVVYGANFPARTWHDFSAQVLSGQPVLQFPTPESSLMPPTKYITSPALVHDDVLDHNGAYYSYPGGGSGNPRYSPPTTAYTAPITTTPPASPPPSAPPSTAPPKTTPTVPAGHGHGKPGG